MTTESGTTPGNETYFSPVIEGTRTPAADSATDELASSLHHSILGVPLAIAVLVGLAWSVRAFQSGTPVGIGGLLVALGGGYWILDLFRQGLRGR